MEQPFAGPARCSTRERFLLTSTSVLSRSNSMLAPVSPRWVSAECRDRATGARLLVQAPDNPIDLYKERPAQRLFTRASTQGGDEEAR
ncbi:hypothetical protein [Streptomyces sp. NPDC055036]